MYVSMYLCFLVRSFGAMFFRYCLLYFLEVFIIGNFIIK